MKGVPVYPIQERAKKRKLPGLRVTPTKPRRNRKSESQAVARRGTREKGHLGGKEGVLTERKEGCSSGKRGDPTYRPPKKKKKVSSMGGRKLDEKTLRGKGGGSMMRKSKGKKERPPRIEQKPTMYGIALFFEWEKKEKKNRTSERGGDEKRNHLKNRKRLARN